MAETTQRNGRRGFPILTASAVILAAAIILNGLYYGSGFLIPIVIAFLIASLLENFVERLERYGVPTALSFVIAIATSLLLMLLLVFILSAQADAVMQALPRYQARVEGLIADVFAWMGPDVTRRVTEAFQEIDLASRIGGLLGSAGGLVLNVLMVLLYVSFLLAERGRFSRKLLSLCARTSERAELQTIMTSVWKGISQYLWIKTLMSLLTGFTSYVILKSMDVDFAETWGLVIFLLNYIPSIGSVLGVLFPAVVALVQFDTLWQFLTIAIVLAAFQLTIGNVLEPYLMGRSLNLSPFVVIVSLVFWGMIWGIAGAFLSVPIMVAILIVCSNVPSWQWIAIILSEDGKLSHGAGKPKSVDASAAKMTG